MPPATSTANRPSSAIGPRTERTGRTAVAIASKEVPDIAQTLPAGTWAILTARVHDACGGMYRSRQPTRRWPAQPDRRARCPWPRANRRGRPYRDRSPDNSADSSMQQRGNGRRRVGGSITGHRSTGAARLIMMDEPSRCHHDKALDLEGELADNEVLTYLQMISPDELRAAPKPRVALRVRCQSGGGRATGSDGRA